MPATSQLAYFSKKLHIKWTLFSDKKKTCSQFWYQISLYAKVTLSLPLSAHISTPCWTWHWFFLRTLPILSTFSASTLLAPSILPPLSIFSSPSYCFTLCFLFFTVCTLLTPPLFIPLQPQHLLFPLCLAHTAVLHSSCSYCSLHWGLRLPRENPP